MAGQYLIDTNTAIDYLNNKLSPSVSILLEEQQIQISVITRMELLAWPNATPPQLQVLESFINSTLVYGLDESVVLKTIEVRKKYKVKLPDAIIAATAMTNGLILLTRNTGDFQRILSLQLSNPWEM